MKIKKGRKKQAVLKAPWEIEKLRQANRIVAETLASLREALKPGVTTADLDHLATEGILSRGGIPAFKGYRGYPATLCVSVNEEVVHGIPSARKIIAEGDIVSMDLGAIYDEYYGDAAISGVVGAGAPEARRLVEVTEKALMEGIAQIQVRRHLQDISWAIQRCVEEAGFNVVRKFVGHGIGRALHEPPEVPNFGHPGHGPMLREGMVLAIEPMVNAGTGDVRVLEDGWTAVSADGSLSAHFEHSVAIGEHGPEILSSVD